MVGVARRRVLIGVIRTFVIVPIGIALAWLLLWPTNSGVPTLILAVGAIVGGVWGGIEIVGGVRLWRALKSNLPEARVIE